MYLIDTRNLELVESPNPESVRYAILSHTWGPPDHEVSLQEMLQPNRSEETIYKPGFSKIAKTCEIAWREYGLEYAWVDTCCIDKSSSAELSEAINSMFRWYEYAEVCLAYLEDVADDRVEFGESRWFKRGWTLQELIAPHTITFFDRDWRLLGSKWGSNELGPQIFEITKIPLAILYKFVELGEIPVAQRFSWAASRETTRREDIAYCLMGIFDVNMPLLYGEGDKAFIRLQEQILAQSADLSLFLWTFSGLVDKEFNGLLADSPACFTEMTHVVVEPSFTEREFYLTNRGIRFKMGLAWDPSTDLAVMPLRHTPSNTEAPVGIYLRRVGLDTFVRARPTDFTIVSSLRQFDKFTVLKSMTHAQVDRLIKNTLLIDVSRDIMIIEVEPRGSWAPDSQLLYPSHTGAFMAYVVFQKHGFPSFTVVYWFRREVWSARVVLAHDWENTRKDFYQLYKAMVPGLTTERDLNTTQIPGPRETNIVIHPVRRHVFPTRLMSRSSMRILIEDHSNSRASPRNILARLE